MAALEHVSLEEHVSSAEVGNPARAVEISRSDEQIAEATATVDEELTAGFETTTFKKNKRAQLERVAAEMAALRTRLAQITLPAAPLRADVTNQAVHAQQAQVRAMRESHELFNDEAKHQQDRTLQLEAATNAIKEALGIDFDKSGPSVV